MANLPWNQTAVAAFLGRPSGGDNGILWKIIQSRRKRCKKRKGEYGGHEKRRRRWACPRGPLQRREVREQNRTESNRGWKEILADATAATFRRNQEPVYAFTCLMGWGTTAHVRNVKAERRSCRLA